MERKLKLIQLSEEAVTRLSVMAEGKGMLLKPFMECVLENYVAGKKCNVKPAKKQGPEKKEVMEAVFLTEVETEKLQTHFGLAYQWALETLSNYKLSSGKKYKSDYHAIRGWVNDKFIKEKQNGKPESTFQRSLETIANYQRHQ